MASRYALFTLVGMTTSTLPISRPCRRHRQVQSRRRIGMAG